MAVAEYKAYFHTLSIYFHASVATESKKIWMFVKGLDISLLLAMTQVVVYGESF